MKNARTNCTKPEMKIWIGYAVSNFLQDTLYIS